MSPEADIKRVVAVLTRIALAAVIVAGCASTRSAAGDGTLTLTITPQRSQPGCPIIVGVQISATELQVVDSKLTWRVAHGRNERRGTLQAIPPGGRTAEVEFTPARPGTYDIEARVVYETGRISVAKLRHDVAHRWPFQAPRPCDFEQSAPHETSDWTPRASPSSKARSERLPAPSEAGRPGRDRPRWGGATP